MDPRAFASKSEVRDRRRLVPLQSVSSWWIESDCYTASGCWLKCLEMLVRLWLSLKNTGYFVLHRGQTVMVFYASVAIATYVVGVVDNQHLDQVILFKFIHSYKVELSDIIPTQNSEYRRDDAKRKEREREMMQKRSEMMHRSFYLLFNGLIV
jgi:hypothetical protein